MVAYEGDRRTVGLDPKTEGRTYVGHLTNHDLGRTDRDLLVECFAEVDGALELLHVYREEGRVKDPVEEVVERPAHLWGPVHIQDRGWMMGGCEEGQADDVVP